MAPWVPTLLFLPGTLCDARVWEATCQELDGDWPCAFADYRFETSISAMATAALAGVQGAIIPIGLSMGGMVALEIWRQAAERVAALALFDMDPGADTPERCARRDAQLRSARRGEFRAMVESELAPVYFSPARRANAALSAREVSLRSTVVAMAIDQGVDAFAAQATALATRVDAWPLLEKIKVPTLVACGADDRICPPETHMRMAALLPVATFRSIRAAGHLAPLEQPEGTAHVLQTWLDGQ